VDPDSGAFLPADGQGVLVDKNAAAATTFGNGPEWAISAQGSQLVYSSTSPTKPRPRAVSDWVWPAWWEASGPPNC
jgi:hypothetical protein